MMGPLMKSISIFSVDVQKNGTHHTYVTQKIRSLHLSGSARARLKIDDKSRFSEIFFGEMLGQTAKVFDHIVHLNFLTMNRALYTKV